MACGWTDQSGQGVGIDDCAVMGLGCCALLARLALGHWGDGVKSSGNIQVVRVLFLAAMQVPAC